MNDDQPRPPEASIASGPTVTPSGPRHALTSGVRWTGLSQAVNVTLQFVVAIVLARLLAPADFGLLAMAAAIIAIVSALQSLGMHGPLIQREELPRELVDTVFLLNLALALLLATVVFLAAPVLAHFYRTPAVEPIIRVISVTLVVYAVGGVPGALLRRRIRFGAIALATTTGAVLYAVVAITLALRGHGVWSMVVGLLVASTVEAALLFIAARHWPGLRFSWHQLRSIAGFSANMTGVNLLHLVLQNADSLIIGRWLGPGAVGLFGMATRFTRQPVHVLVTAVLGPVLFPTYSRMQGDDTMTGRTMCRALAGASLVMFPLLGGIAAVARPFVDAVLGPQWAGATLLIVLMAPIGMARAMLSTVTTVFLARDRTRLYLAIKLVAGSALIGAYLLGVQYSLVAVALAVLVVELLAVAGELALSARLAGLRPATLLAGALGPLLATAVMAVAVAALDRVLLAAGLPDLLILGLCVALGMAIYTAAVLWLRLEAVEDLLDLLPSSVARRLRGVMPRYGTGHA